MHSFPVPWAIIFADVEFVILANRILTYDSLVPASLCDASATMHGAYFDTSLLWSGAADSPECVCSSCGSVPVVPRAASCH